MSDTRITGSGWSKERRSSHSELISRIAVGDGLLKLESHHRGTTIVVVVAGEIDLLVADRLRELLTEQVSAHPEVLVIDLEEVQFFGSTGLTTLALIQRTAREEGVDLRVVATSRATLRPLQITGMADEFAIYASRRDALAGCSSDGPDSLPAPRT